MSKEEQVPNTVPSGPHDAPADSATFEGIAASWDSVAAKLAAEDAVEEAAQIQAEETEALPGTPPPAQAAAGEVGAPQEDETAEQLLARARQEAESWRTRRQERNFDQEIQQARAEAEALKTRLKRNPLEVIKELGLNPIDFANTAYAEALGDDAPKDFKDKLSQSAMERRVEQKLQELEQREQQWQQAQQQREQQARVQQLDNELVQSVIEVPEQYTFVKRAATRDQQYAYNALVEAANQYFAASGGQLPTAAQTLKIAEAGLAKLRTVLADDEPAVKAPATEGSENRKPKSKALTDTDTAERPSRKRDDDLDPRDANAWARAALRTLDKSRKA